MQKWEYLWQYFYKADSANVETTWNHKKYNGYQKCAEALNEIGELGWELICVTSNSDQHGYYMQVQMLFKRPKE